MVVTDQVINVTWKIIVEGLGLAGVWRMTVGRPGSKEDQEHMLLDSPEEMKMVTIIQSTEMKKRAGKYTLVFMPWSTTQRLSHWRDRIQALEGFWQEHVMDSFIVWVDCIFRAAVGWEGEMEGCSETAKPAHR